MREQREQREGERARERESEAVRLSTASEDHKTSLCTVAEAPQ